MEILKYAPGKNPNSHKKGRRKYSVNDSFFSEPNEVNSYYAGFIAADGCIRSNNSEKSRYLIFGLSIKDKEWLEHFANDIEFTGPITEYTFRGKKYVRMSINSKQICDDLEKNFNITPRKTATLIPPPLTETNLIDSFICGYIDGDGYICFSAYHKKNVQKRCIIGCLGTYKITSWVSQRFSEICGFENKKEPYKGRGGFNKEELKNIYTFHIGDKQARQVISHMIQYNIPLMKRKWSDEIIEYCKTFKKKLPLCRRKGINVFNLDGKLLKHCETLEEAKIFTGVSVGRISDLCKMNNNEHMAHGYMFSRDKEKMEPYKQDNPFARKCINEIKERLA